MLTDKQKHRYHRQILFAELGEQGQIKLSEAKVVLIGCGGLGSNIAQGLVRSGIGKLRLIDADTPDITNLHRQFLYNEQDIIEKQKKADIAQTKLSQANTEVDIEALSTRFNSQNADDLLTGFDLVLDGTDNMASRYVINDWCIKHRVPWIYGGVVDAVGMIKVIIPDQTACLCCLYPETEPSNIVKPEKVLGIINSTPTLIAALQVTEAIKFLIGSRDLITDLRIIDLWTGDYQRLKVDKHSDCPCCGLRRFPFLNAK